MSDEIQNMLPDLQFSILCDDVVQDKITGKLVLHGVFSNIEGRQLPMTHNKCFVINGWCGGLGTFKQKTKMVTPEKQILIEDRETEFTLFDTRSKHTVIAQFNNLAFKTQGTYWVEIYLDNRLMLSYPFEIKVKQRVT